MCVTVVRGWHRCLHVSPLACMRSNLEAKVPDPHKGESPCLGETGQDSAPTCEPTWFYMTLWPKQTQTKRELRRATPVRGTSRGVDDPSAHRDQGFAGGRPREHCNEMKTCM